MPAVASTTLFIEISIFLSNRAQSLKLLHLSWLSTALSLLWLHFTVKKSNNLLILGKSAWTSFAQLKPINFRAARVANLEHSGSNRCFLALSFRQHSINHNGLLVLWVARINFKFKTFHIQWSLLRLLFSFDSLTAPFRQPEDRDMGHKYGNSRSKRIKIQD